MLPLFILIKLIQFCKEEKREPFIIFLDYEKKVGYANRENILEKLMNEGCGKNYVRAVANFYQESLYVPNQLGKYIPSKHGVTKVSDYLLISSLSTCLIWVKLSKMFGIMTF